MALDGPTISQPEIPGGDEQLSNQSFYMTISFPVPGTPTPGSEVITEVGARMNPDSRGTTRTFFFGPNKLDSNTGSGIKAQIQALLDDPNMINRDLMDLVVNLVSNNGDERIEDGGVGASADTNDAYVFLRRPTRKREIVVPRDLTPVRLVNQEAKPPVNFTLNGDGTVSPLIDGLFQMFYKIDAQRSASEPTGDSGLRVVAYKNGSEESGTDANITLKNGDIENVCNGFPISLKTTDRVGLAVESLGPRFKMDVVSATMNLSRRGDNG